MTTRASIRQVDIARAIRAALDAGLSVAEVLVEHGQARVLIAKKPVAESPATDAGLAPKAWPKG